MAVPAERKVIPAPNEASATPETISPSDLSAAFIAETGVLPEGASYESATGLVPWTRMGTETYFRADTIRFSVNGEKHQRDLAQQAILSTTGCGPAARARFARLELLRDSGAPTPPIYGLNGADVFTGYIRGNRDPELGLRVINSPERPVEERTALLDQLSGIAAVLDARGFIPGTPFYKDLLFNGDSFYVIDTGFDLGGPDQSKPTTQSLRALRSACPPTLHQAITEHYDRFRSMIV